MPETHSSKHTELSKYDDMETSQLEQLLRADAVAPEVTTDTEVLLHIMGILASRRNASSPGRAWEDFQQHYLPDKTPVRDNPKPAKPWLHHLTAAAAVLVLLISIPVLTNAIERGNPHGIAATWDSENFHFAGYDDAETICPIKGSTEGYTSFSQMLEEHGREPYMMPSWIPKGFELDRMLTDVSSYDEVYCAHYTKDDKDLILRVTVEADPNSGILPVDGGSAQIYRYGSTDYYIFTNLEQLRAFWLDGSCKCSISGDLTVWQLKKMIQSIGKE